MIKEYFAKIADNFTREFPNVKELHSQKESLNLVLKDITGMFFNSRWWPYKPLVMELVLKWQCQYNPSHSKKSHYERCIKLDKTGVCSPVEMSLMYDWGYLCNENLGTCSLHNTHQIILPYHCIAARPWLMDLPDCFDRNVLDLMESSYFLMSFDGWCKNFGIFQLLASGHDLGVRANGSAYLWLN